VAKKVRRKPEELSPEHSFAFPAFDEAKFVVHELEQSRATILAILLTVGISLASWAVFAAHLPWFVAAIVGLAVIASSPLLIQRLRPPSHEYTRGEWATLILLQFFGWLGLWFLLLDLLPTG
jgi:hypothetical protein